MGYCCNHHLLYRHYPEYGLPDYGIGAQILRELGVTKIKLLSNNPRKRTGLIGYGLEIVENIPLEIKSNQHNELYLKTKRDKLGHTLKLG